MATRDEIVKQNLEFVYGKRTNDVLDDPDKVSYRPTKAKYVDPDAITNFSGEFAFLAPTFTCKVYLPEDSTAYPSFEHALLASKFKNDDKRQEVRALPEIKDVKRLISKEKGKTSVLYADWTERCISIAEMLLLDKFIRNKKLKEQLMKTGRRTLIFKNDFGDLFWGVDDTQKGQNHLGKLLEKIRNVIDQGEELDIWVRHQVKLLEAEKVSLEVIVSKEGVKVSEDCKTIELKSKFFVGKSEDMCDIVAAHPTVSRVHALLVVERTEGRLQVIDLGSANGTKLNNTPLQPFEIVTLTQGDVLTFGASARQYSFVLDTTADEKRKLLLLEKIALEQKASSSVYGGTSRSAEETAINTVFVGNIAFDATESDIKAFFAPCGEMVQMSVPKDRSSGAHKGIAFVTFADFKGVMQALARDGDELAGRNVKVKKSDAKKPGTGTGAGGNRGGERSEREQRDHRPQSEKDRDIEGRGRGDRDERYGGRDSGRYGVQQQTRRDQSDRSPLRRESRWDSSKERDDRTRESRATDRERDSDRDHRQRGSERGDRRDREHRREDSRDRRDAHRPSDGYDRGDRSDRNNNRSDRDRKRGRSDSRDRDSRTNREYDRSRDKDQRRGRSPSPRRSPPRRESKQARLEERSSRDGRSRRARSSSPSPERCRPVAASSPSPPRHINTNSTSPPRRGRAASPSRSASPPRRPRAASPSSPSPPRRTQKQEEVSPSPPRRGRAASPSPSPSSARRQRQSSPSPPRRPRASSPAGVSRSPSPPRRARAASPSRSRSPSPPRKPRASSGENSPSPPRRHRSPSPTPSPPRRSRFN